MKISTAGVNATDFKIYEATPGISIILRAEASAYIIVASSNDFISFSGFLRETIVGKNYLDLLPDNMSDRNAAISDLKNSFERAINRAAPDEMPLQSWGPPRRDGGITPGYWTMRSVPMMDDSGTVQYIIHAAAEVTERVIAEDKLQSVKGIERAYRFFAQAPVIVGFLRGNDYLIEHANERLLKIWQRTSEIVGRPLFHEFPELEVQGVKKLLDDVRSTGKPFYAYEYPMTFNLDGKDQTFYFDFIYQAYYESDEKMATGVISVGHDVTEKVLAKQKFKNVIEQANTPILILKGEDMVLEAANNALLKLWGTDESALGKRLADLRPSAQSQGFLSLLLNVYRTGEPYQGFGAPVTVEVNGIKKILYYNYNYQPYREANGEIIGVVIIASDATEQIHAKRQLEESQKKWRQLADTMPAIVWTTGADGATNFLNQRWYEYTGLTESESLGFGWAKVLHPDDADKSRRAWELAMKKQKHYEVEVRYRSKDGEYRWMISRGVPIKEEDKLVGWYGTSTEIHGQKQLELQLEDKVRERTEELAAKNMLLDNILTNSSNGISVTEMIFDKSGNVVDAMTIMANDAAVKFSGIPRELYLSKRATEIDPNILSSPYGQGCINTLRTGTPSIMQYFLEFSGKWLELTVSKMDDSHLIHIFTDVTPIKKTQLELERSLEDLKFANANLEEFAYAASHDLKEPVRKIHYFSNRLREGLNDRINEKEASMFDRLEKSSVRMEKLIDDLLHYSQAAKGSIDFEEIDLNEKIKLVLEDLELEIQKKQAVVTADTLPTIYGHRRQIQQLFQNLIGNAIKYAKPGIPPQITITSKVCKANEFLKDLPSVAPDKSFYMIKVSDNGIGFDPKDADKVFNLFTRLHSTSEYRGSGIGLSIVKRVVESHDGFVWADSKAGEGSTFTLLFPVRR